ncbi:hypothetical protein Enr13x_39320 [Stieleria neptunia]|uniref:PXPV repeat protein n=1 Tax=Stieleria neptunia TaxID=2527979 RepID=A0A518HTC8_9BACT|nr:hypothetical protein [Stieleria neptunia]QDV44071.1 hypothetical protein Enr13x_39320 [Stieleria neptunia]
MKALIVGLALLASATMVSSAEAQYGAAQYVGIDIYAPRYAAPVARPVFVPPVLYPAPVVVRPYAVAPVAPVVVPRPRYRFYTPYGGSEVRVPGRPVANTLRAIIR